MGKLTPEQQKRIRDVLGLPKDSLIEVSSDIDIPGILGKGNGMKRSYLLVLAFSAYCIGATVGFAYLGIELVHRYQNTVASSNGHDTSWNDLATVLSFIAVSYAVIVATLGGFLYCMVRDVYSAHLSDNRKRDGIS